MDLKSYVLGIIDYTRYQVENDECDLEEIRELADYLSERFNARATIRDLSRHYGQSESNIRNVIGRKYLGKPERRVMYRLGLFNRIIPDSWRKSHN